MCLIDLHKKFKYQSYRKEIVAFFYFRILTDGGHGRHGPNVVKNVAQALPTEYDTVTGPRMAIVRASRNNIKRAIGRYDCNMIH